MKNLEQTFFHEMPIEPRSERKSDIINRLLQYYEKQCCNKFVLLAVFLSLIRYGACFCSVEFIALCLCLSDTKE